MHNEGFFYDLQMRMKYYRFFIVASLLIFFSCQSIDLGQQIFLMRGDRPEDGILVICNNRKNYGECISGTYLIPQNYNAHFDSFGKYKEYVSKYAVNDAYVLAATILVNTKESRYWIIDKRRNKAPLVLGPLDKNSFFLEKRSRGIDLQLKPAW